MGDLARLFDSVPNSPDLAAAFDSTAPAEKLAPLPAGEYPARWSACGLGESRKGTPLFFGRFEITSVEHAGRRLTHRWYLSKAALRYSRRELGTLGLTRFADLERGATPGGPVRLRVALRRDDSGGTFNEIRAVLPGGTMLSHTREAAAAPLAPAATKPITERATATLDDLPAALLDPALL